MADMSPADVAAYRDAQLTAMGLQNDGTGNYYSPDYFAGRPAALAAKAANTAATAASGRFSGVQDFGAPPAAPQGGLAAASQALSAPGLGSTGFGGGAAHSGFSADQNATIRSAWNDLLYGNRTPASVMSDMSQYGVNFADISAATGVPVDQLMSYLGKSQVSSSSGGGTQPAPAQGYSPVNRPGGITQYPQMPVRPVLGGLSGPAPLPGTGGGRPSYLPASWRTNYAEGGAVSYNPERVDSIYNQLKAELNG